MGKEERTLRIEKTKGKGRKQFFIGSDGEKLRPAAVIRPGGQEEEDDGIPEGPVLSKLWCVNMARCVDSPHHRELYGDKLWFFEIHGTDGDNWTIERHADETECRARALEFGTFSGLPVFRMGEKIESE